MHKSHYPLYFILTIILLTACKQPDLSRSIKTVNQSSSHDTMPLKIDSISLGDVPNHITRSIIEDNDGNIWFATFNGMIKFDGTSFTNITNGISKARFFSVLQDRNGKFWFGSIGEGVYRFDGTSFDNFTTKDGLIEDGVVSILEDSRGDIWFGADGGISRFDSKTFNNYYIEGDTLSEDSTGMRLPNRNQHLNEVNAIVEDKKGNYWIASRGYTYIYDGEAFTIVEQEGQSFSNVRWIIEDSNDNIWLGGNDGLWMYNGSHFAQINKNFTGFIYEDQAGNIWTSSQSGISWSLDRYNAQSINMGNPKAETMKTGEGMFFGILEDKNSDIWAGTLQGIYRYDGEKFDDYKGLMKTKKSSFPYTEN